MKPTLFWLLDKRWYCALFLEDFSSHKDFIFWNRFKANVYFEINHRPRCFQKFFQFMETFPQNVIIFITLQAFTLENSTKMHCWQILCLFLS